MCTESTELAFGGEGSQFTDVGIADRKQNDIRALGRVDRIRHVGAVVGLSPTGAEVRRHAGPVAQRVRAVEVACT